MKEFSNLNKVLDNYKNELISRYRQESGYDIDLVISVVRDDKDSIVIYVDGPDAAIWSSRGRRSGKFPPTNVLQEWVQKKGLATELPRVKQLAFLIGRSIAEKGTSGNHLLDKIFGELLNKYASQLQSALVKDVEEDTKEMENKINDMLSKVL